MTGTLDAVVPLRFMTLQQCIDASAAGLET
jgi:hypothetical protein